MSPEHEPISLRPVDKIVPYEQKYYFSCGPASLAIAYKCLGHNHTEERIMRELDASVMGTEWWELLHHVADITEYGVSMRFRATFEEMKEELDKFGFPIIICWQTDRRRTPVEGGLGAEPGGHYSVVKSMTDTEITLADPGFGDIATFPREYLEDRWYEENTERVYLAIRPR